VVGSCEQSNEHSGSIKGEFDKLSYYYLLKNNTAPCRLLVTKTRKEDMKNDWKGVLFGEH